MSCMQKVAHSKFSKMVIVPQGYSQMEYNIHKNSANRFPSFEPRTA